MTDTRTAFPFGENDRARRLASLLKAIEDEEILFSEVRFTHKERLEKLHHEVKALGFAILSGQEELPLVEAEKVPNV